MNIILPGDIDWVIVRKNSGGEYAGQGGRSYLSFPEEIATEVADEFPEVTWDKILVDAMTVRMTLKAGNARHHPGDQPPRRHPIRSDCGTRSNRKRSVWLMKGCYSLQYLPVGYKRVYRLMNENGLLVPQMDQRSE
jgi:hypothetical protein